MPDLHPGAKVRFPVPSRTSPTVIREGVCVSAYAGLWAVHTLTPPHILAVLPAERLEVTGEAGEAARVIRRRLAGERKVGRKRAPAQGVLTGMEVGA